MVATVTNQSAVLKTLYPNNLPKDLTYKDFPFLASLPSKTDFFGDSVKVPVKYGNLASRSSSFSVAQSISSSASSAAFLVTRSKDYALATVENELIQASKNNMGAFVANLKFQVDSAAMILTESLAQSVAGNGSGSIGVVANSSFATTDLQLLDIQQVVNFEVGQYLQASDTESGGAVKAGELIIAGVNRTTGVLTMTGNLSTGIASIAQGDFLYSKGDYDAKIKGFQAWIPSTAPSATPFYGVNRTTDSRLGGLRGDFTSLPAEEALVEMLALGNREGARFDNIWLNYKSYGNLEKALGAKVQYVDMNFKDVGVSFRGIKFSSGRGVVNILPDITIPSGKAFAVQTNTWCLHTLGGAPQILNFDGNEGLRVYNADQLETRLGYYGQLWCNAPGYNGNFSINF